MTLDSIVVRLLTSAALAPEPLSSELKGIATDLAREISSSRRPCTADQDGQQSLRLEQAPPAGERQPTRLPETRLAEAARTAVQVTSATNALFSKAVFSNQIVTSETMAEKEEPPASFATATPDTFDQGPPPARLSVSGSTLGKTQVRVRLPGMKAAIECSEVPSKQYTVLPESLPRIILPSSGRPFLSTPRGIMPFQRGYGNDKYQQSIGEDGHSSERTSMYSGSMSAGGIGQQSETVKVASGEARQGGPAHGSEARKRQLPPAATELPEKRIKLGALTALQAPQSVPAVSDVPAALPAVERERYTLPSERLVPEIMTAKDWQRRFDDLFGYLKDRHHAFGSSGAGGTDHQ